MKQHAEAKQYIEPDGFKGTKGEWATMKIRDGIAIKEKDLIERGFSDRIAELYNYNHEIEANAKLISQSKNLAKALQDMIKEYGYAMKLLAEASGMAYSENSVTINAKQVLKEAGL